MRNVLYLTAIAAVLISASACGVQSGKIAARAGEGMSSEKILLAEWSGPYGGVPAFDKMQLDGLQPAVEAA